MRKNENHDFNFKIPLKDEVKQQNKMNECMVGETEIAWLMIHLTSVFLQIISFKLRSSFLIIRSVDTSLWLQMNH